MTKHVMTTERAMELLDSLQFMYIMVTMVEIEYQKLLVDTKFVNPQINMFAKRIKSDSQAIKRFIQQRVNVKDADFAEDYTLELSDVFTHFIGIDIEEIRAFMSAVKEKVIA